MTGWTTDISGLRVRAAVGCLHTWSTTSPMLRRWQRLTFNLGIIDVDDRRRFFLHQIPILKHLQIYAIYDWLAYNENKEGAPAQEQGGQIFQNKHRGLLYIFAKSFKYNIALKKTCELLRI